MENTSRLAIASLVLGICSVILGWLPFIGIIFPVLAIIFGIIALNNINSSSLSGKGMAIAGIIIGGVMLLFIILIGVLGIIFINKMFTTTAAMNTEIGEVDTHMHSELERELLESMDRSGNNIMIKQSEIQLYPGKEQKFIFALKNDLSSEKCFYPQFYCDQSLSGSCSDFQPGNNWDIFQKIDSKKIKSGFAEVFDTEALARDPGYGGTYQGRILIWQGEPPCEEIDFSVAAPDEKVYSDSKGSLELYAQETFFVDV